MLQILQETMEQCRAQLEKRQWMFATAESITGGGLGECWTRQSGSSDTYLGGVIAYNNEIKQSLLQVKAQLLHEYSAVSEQVAAAMLQGLWPLFPNAKVGIAVTGYAEGGAEPGLVWIAVGTPHHEPSVVSMHGTGDRHQVREQARILAYQQLSDYITKL